MGFVADSIRKGYKGSAFAKLAKAELAKRAASKPPVEVNFSEVWSPNPGPQEQFFNTDCREVLYGGSAGGGKLLRVDEPIPTPTGWTTMGELQPGDFVLDCDGNPTRVNWCSEVEENPDAWELVFDDGTTIQCDAGHQWVTLTDADRSALMRLSDEWRAKRRASRPRRISGNKSEAFTAAIAARNSRLAQSRVAPPPARGTTKTTQEIVDTLFVRETRVNHSIPNPGPLQLPEAELVVDPYVLGAWLGDGDSAGSCMTGLDAEVWENAEAVGFEVRHRPDGLRRCFVGLVTQLRKIGVYRNKHIPQEYLRGSFAQRVALLQGLCDTDGHATTKGSIEFTTTSPALAAGMCELLASLGIKPSCREGRATLYGRDISAKWRIQFWTDIPAFRVQRQLERQKLSGFRGTHSQRYIVDARRVPPTPMRCIGVEAESKTYLAGRSMVVTHNSSALTALILRYSHLPGFNGVVFRRDSTQFKDLIDKSKALFPKVYPGLEPVHSPYFVWTFPSGATANYRHCQHEKDAAKFDGWEINLLAFDELTHFTEKQYLALCARVRSSKQNLPTFIRATTNPGGEGHDWVFRRWGAWLDPEFTADGLETRYDVDGETKLPPAKPGEVFWICKRNGRETYYREDPKFEDAQALSRTFIPSTIDDNPHLLDNDPNYIAQLEELDPVRYEQLRRGNWLAKPAAGLYFKRACIEFVDAPPTTGVILRARAWDLAATEPTPANPNPDWTAGVKMSFSEDSVCIEDVERGQWDPAGVQERVKGTAELDGKSVYIILPQDPAQAGKSQLHHYAILLRGWSVIGRPPSGDKLIRFSPFSGFVNLKNGGVKRLKMVRGPWNKAFIEELEAFPSPGIKDDQVDATSDVFNVLSESVGARPKTTSSGSTVVDTSDRN